MRTAWRPLLHKKAVRRIYVQVIEKPFVFISFYKRVIFRVVVAVCRNMGLGIVDYQTGIGGENKPLPPLVTDNVADIPVVNKGEVVRWYKSMAAGIVLKKLPGFTEMQ